MKITLLTVGKTDKDWVRQGLDIYVSRLKHYIPFGIVEIPELKNVSALSKEQIKNKEGELILKNIRQTDDVILLDERGKEYTSFIRRQGYRIRNRRSIRILRCSISEIQFQALPVQNDILPPDGKSDLRRTDISGFYHNARRALPPRIKIIG